MPSVGLVRILSSSLSDPVFVSGGVGVFAGLLSIVIPVGIWLIAMRPWKPKSRISYASRFSLWPCLLFSTQLGGPLARHVSGYESKYLMGFVQSLMAVLLLSLVAAPFAFGLGYLLSKSRFSTKADLRKQRRMESASSAATDREAATDSRESLHREIHKQLLQTPRDFTQEEQSAKLEGRGAVVAAPHPTAPSRSFQARWILGILVMIVVVVLCVQLAGSFKGKEAGNHAPSADRDGIAIPRPPNPSLSRSSQAKAPNFPFLEATRPKTYPVSRAWWSEEDGCGALFPEVPKRNVFANGVKVVGYQGTIDLGRDGTAVACVTVQPLDHKDVKDVGEAALLGIYHDAFVASIGASGANSERQGGTHPCGGTMLSYSVDWDGPDGARLTSTGFWVIHAEKVYRAGVMFHRDIEAESARLVRHFPTTLTLLCGDYTHLPEEPQLRAQEDFDTKEPRWKQLSQAFGYARGQQTTLELVERKFPTLARDANEAWLEFNSTALGESVKGVEDELARELGAQWPEYREQMVTHLNALLDKQDLTLQQAAEFLAEVRRRAKGDIPETIRSTLLSVHPRYSKNPALELSDGWKKTFRTKDHPKAKGVDFSISVPASWSKREGDRPNIIQVFRSGSGHGPIMCNLMVKAIPLTAGYSPTKQDLKEFFQPDELKGMVPDGGQFVTAQELVLEGAPAGMLVCDITQQRLDVAITMRMTQFVTFHKNSMVFIQFIVFKQPSTVDTLDQLQQQFLPTFMSVANTFVLNDRYK